MIKIILFIYLLLSMHFLNNYSYIGLKLRGDPVINVITTEETYSWEKKDETPDKKYYAVYTNGGYRETEKFDPDDIIKYYVDTDTFSSEIVGSRIVNKVINPTVMDNNYALIDPDDRILGIINAAADSIKNTICRFEIFKDKDKYFAFIWLNVNWSSPCELYEYDIENKSIHRLCGWDDVDIVGISVPDSTKEFDSV